MTEIQTNQKIGLILIGDELLSGVRQDKHLSHSIEMLKARGMSLSWVRMIGDAREEIVDTLKQTMVLNDVVFSFGGIGATPDDQTRAAAGEAFHKEVILHPEAEALLLEKFGDEVYPHRILMAEIAENAEGGLRDAISLLDQAISYADEQITEDDVHQVSGSVSKTALTDILLAIINKEISKAIVILKDLLADGKEISRIVTDLILALRDILLEKTIEVDLPKYSDIVKIFPVEKVYYYLDVLNKCQQDMKWTHQKRAYVELALIKMMEHQTLRQIDFEATILDLKQSIQDLKETAKSQPVITKQSSAEPLVTVKDVQRILNNGDKEKKQTLISGWSYLKNYPKEHLKMAAYLLYQGELEAVSDHMLIIYDDLNMCKKMYDAEVVEQVLEIINNKNDLIKGYYAILKTDWLVIKEVYSDLYRNKGQKKPKLPPYDFKLYKDAKKEKKESETISLAQEYFGDKVKTTFVENVPEGADAERVITQLAKAGNDLIFTTSFGFMNPTVKVAKRFPKVKFEHATGYKLDKNLGTYVLRTYEGRYISGVAAGMMTKTNTIGYIGSFPIPEVIRDINAAYMGAKSVNPDVKMKIVWANTWYDPGKETDAANALMDQGVDVMLQHTDSPAPLIAAEKRGLRAIGQASDQSKFAPEAHIFSVRDDWTPYYVKRVQAVMDGTWKAQDFWGGFQDDMLTLASINPNLPAEVRAKIDATHDAIKSGAFKPFTGPIKDNKGNIAVPADHSLTDVELAQVNWYVEGITDEIPR
mgnify:CR=1 FL=1